MAEAAKETASQTILDDPKAMAAISYLLGGAGAFLDYGIFSIIFVALPLVVYFYRKQDEFVRFHAFQAFLWSLVLFIIGYVLWIVTAQQAAAAIYGPMSYYYGAAGFFGLASLLSLISVIVDIFLAIKAYGGEKIKLPVLGDMAEKPFL